MRRKKSHYWFFFGVGFCFLSCHLEKESTSTLDTYETSENEINKKINFIALGDSYTIGEGISYSANWPNQLTFELRSNHDFEISTDIVAETGYRVIDLTSSLRNRSFDQTYSLVSIMIGVNDQFIGIPIERFRSDLVSLVEFIKAEPSFTNSKIFFVSIPDWGYTPFGTNYDLNAVSISIDNYNAVIKSISTQFNIEYIDITRISRKSRNDWSLVISDGLHPNEKMYSSWVELILSRVLIMLKK